nr:hypothetical protein [uncultured Desulfobacter sp.]
MTAADTFNNSNKNQNGYGCKTIPIFTSSIVPERLSMFAQKFANTEKGKQS